MRFVIECSSASKEQLQSCNYGVGWASAHHQPRHDGGLQPPLRLEEVHGIAVVVSAAMPLAPLSHLGILLQEATAN